MAFIGDVSPRVFGGEELVTDVGLEDPTDPEIPIDPGAIIGTTGVGFVTITDFGASDKAGQIDASGLGDLFADLEESMLALAFGGDDTTLSYEPDNSTGKLTIHTTEASEEDSFLFQALIAGPISREH